MPARSSACSSTLKIGLRRAQQDRHLVERDAALRFLQQSSGDFDGFASFSGAENRITESSIAPGRRRSMRQTGVSAAAPVPSQVRRLVAASEVRMHQGPCPQRAPRRLQDGRHRQSSPARTTALDEIALRPSRSTATSSSSTCLSPSRFWDRSLNSFVAVDEHRRVIDGAGSLALVDRALEQRGQGRVGLVRRSRRTDRRRPSAVRRACGSARAGNPAMPRPARSSERVFFQEVDR